MEGTDGNLDDIIWSFIFHIFWPELPKKAESNSQVDIVDIFISTCMSFWNMDVK